jgi:1-acyl-sn-glycerol-3-phosphate acyltransferase
MSNMTYTTEEFDDIRPYRDDEVPLAMKRLTQNELLISTVRKIKWPSCPEILKGFANILISFFLKRKLLGIKTITEFQSKIVGKYFIQWVLSNSSDGLTYSGLENLQKDKPYIFITNHRDISLDPALVSYVLHLNGHRIPYVTFGDNLLINDSISDLIRVNNAVIVKRHLSIREQLKASVHLSKYINYIRNEGNNLWISQREGRAKDGIDKTNPAIIKMLYLSDRKKQIDFSIFAKSCNIVPVAISYEKDPCDRIKGWELYRKSQKGEHKKRKNEDLISLAAGVSRDKGRIHLSFGNPLVENFKNEKEVAEAIDTAIHTLYKLWPENYIAYDRLFETEKYSDQYTETEKQTFLSAYQNLVPEVKTFVLKIYANSICSFESHQNIIT